MHKLETRAKKVYNRVCKFIDEIGYNSKVSVQLQYVTLYTTVAMIYVNIKSDTVSISNMRSLLSPHFNTYINNMTNLLRIYIVVQYAS